MRSIIFLNLFYPESSVYSDNINYAKVSLGQKKREGQTQSDTKRIKGV